MAYAKLIDGVLQWAGAEVVAGGRRIINPQPETLLALGYKRVVYPELEDPAALSPEQADELAPVREEYEQTPSEIIVKYRDL